MSRSPMNSEKFLRPAAETYVLLIFFSKHTSTNLFRRGVGFYLNKKCSAFGRFKGRGYLNRLSAKLFLGISQKGNVHVWCSNFVNFRSWAYPKRRRISTSYDEYKSVEFLWTYMHNFLFAALKNLPFFFFFGFQKPILLHKPKTQHQFWDHIWTIQTKYSPNPLSFQSREHTFLFFFFRSDLIWCLF
jgi:hypothetical protein